MSRHYSITCQQCEADAPHLFLTENERNRWANTHARETGHSRWRVGIVTDAETVPAESDHRGDV